MPIWFMVATAVVLSTISLMCFAPMCFVACNKSSVAFAGANVSHFSGS